MKKTTKKQNIRLSVILVASLIVLDQIAKRIAAEWLKGHPSHSYLNGMVQFEYAENRGAFLSLGAQLSEEGRFWIFVFGVFLVLGFCLFTLSKSLHIRYSVVALSLVIAGGIGNLIDRAIRGNVIDYVHMGALGLRTGVFNIADMAISTGVVMLMLQHLVFSDKSDELEKAADRS